MRTVDRFVVLLCSHNGEDFIEDQINSILDQGDIIDTMYVHDFASTDGTRAVLDRLERVVGDRLTVTRHADAPGAAASFIRAMRLTAPLLTDRSLLFLSDQDDVWLPEKSGTIKAEIERRSLSADEPFILFHDVRVVDHMLRTIRPTYYTGKPFLIPRDLDRSRLLMANPAIGHTMLMSAPLARMLAAWPDIDRYLMHDWLAILIASRVGRVEQVPIALSLYRQHGNNVLGAYKARGKTASVSWLLRFVDRMIDQAIAFSRAVRQRPPQPGTRTNGGGLEILCRYGYRPAAAALSIGALVYGPTWQRKAISLLLLTRAIIGPVDKSRRKLL